ncbi:MAG: DUF4411 family protein [Planctomycetaceae bacterium]
MSVSRRYVLDANPFIEAKNRYYGFDICPGFWASLVTQHQAKRVCSIDRVRDELSEQNDAIKAWIEERVPDTFFKKTEDQAVVDRFQEIVQWAYAENQFTQAAKSEFASVADGWVLAFASINNLAVVTHEEYAPDVRRKVPMPNICVEFDIEYVNTFEMLRELGEKFVRSTKRKGKRR